MVAATPPGEPTLASQGVQASLPAPPGAGPRGYSARAVTDAERVAHAVSSMPTVAALSGGPSGSAGTYLPGRVVLGVRVTEQRVEVHVTARYGDRLADVAAAVRAAAVPAAGARPVDVVIEDLS